MAVQPLLDDHPESEDWIYERIHRRERVSRNIDDDDQNYPATGERFADRLARIAGSWYFVAGFASLVVVWVLLNSFALVFKTWEPARIVQIHYQILNILLAVVVGLQIPLLLMRQNKQADRDKQRAALDYEINLKTEIELDYLMRSIDTMTAIDQMGASAWREGLETQEQQIRRVEEQIHKLNEAVHEIRRLLPPSPSA